MPIVQALKIENNIENNNICYYNNTFFQHNLPKSTHILAFPPHVEIGGKTEVKGAFLNICKTTAG